MKVMKFGGSSVDSPANIEKVIGIIKKESETDSVAVVVSAMGRAKKGEKKVTDQLIEMGQMASEGNEAYKVTLKQLINRHRQTIADVLSPSEQERLESWFKKEEEELYGALQALTFFRELSPQILDRIMSFGERLSAAILAAALRTKNLGAEYLDTRPIIKTNARFGEAQVDFNTSNELIQQHFSGRADIQVATGFIGSTDDKRTTTLGRNGSDFTAAILAGALNATEIQIWKDDVIGVMTANPDIVSDAETIHHLTYREAGELAHQGMSAVHSATMIPAQENGIPIVVKSTKHPDHPGTRIDGNHNGDTETIKGVSSMSDIAQFNITGLGMRDKKGLLSRVTGALARADINIIFLVQVSSEQSISFTVLKGDAKKAESALQEELANELGKRGGINPIEYNDQRTILAVVGEKMKGQKGTLATVSGSLAKNGINIISIGQSPDEFNITVIVDKGKEAQALRAIHDAFLHADKTVLHLLVVGPGNIGGELLRQIQARNQEEVEIRVVGIVRSGNRALLNKLGIPLDQWEQEFKDEGKVKKMDLLEAFTEMKKFELTNTVLVDTTSSVDVAMFHPRALESSTAVVTANKTGLGDGMRLYKATMEASEAGQVPIKREATVGAGLPVMSTLERFRKTGDKINKISAVLSGTLSYIFNTYDGSVPFSQLVRQAKALKITEPNPLDDLNMKDMARKMLILAREAGLSMEMEDINIKPFLSNQAMEAKDGDEFFAALEAMDDQIMLDRYNAAKKTGKALRCVATLENGKASVGLDEVEPNHPLYSLSEKDNKISFYTDRYSKRPLTIEGPGAGPEVTADGVLSDILEVADYFS